MLPDSGDSVDFSHSTLPSSPRPCASAIAFRYCACILPDFRRILGVRSQHPLPIGWRPATTLATTLVSSEYRRALKHPQMRCLSGQTAPAPPWGWSCSFPATHQTGVDRYGPVTTYSLGGTSSHVAPCNRSLTICRCCTNRMLAFWLALLIFAMPCYNADASNTLHGAAATLPDSGESVAVFYSAPPCSGAFCCSAAVACSASASAAITSAASGSTPMRFNVSTLLNKPGLIFDQAPGPVAPSY